MKPLRLLVVEDELKIAQALHDFLRVEGYAVEVLHEGSSVVDWVRRESPDAMLLDVMLPGKDGLQICRELREFSSLPILMLTARVEEVDRLLGLDLGADDYLCKPFSLRELAARLRAVLRRCRTETVVDPRCEWQLDAERWELRLGNQSVPLTPVEFRLLQHLMGKPGRVFSRPQLMRQLYEDHRVVSDRTVDSHIRNLRRKLEVFGGDPIQSVYGVGFRWEGTTGPA